MSEEAKSGKRVVGLLLGLVLIAALIAWVAAMELEKRRAVPPEGGSSEGTAVLSEGVLYQAQAGDSAAVIAKDVASGKELWRAELGSVTAMPVLLIREELIEVQIAGTPWMTLDRSTGQPVE
ncbi:MAG TPA: hypothetical protein VLS88_09390 [Polyangiales bacterium]|nr:hypothetical protein [Polyangiales bacterium]